MFSKSRRNRFVKYEFGVLSSPSGVSRGWDVATRTRRPTRTIEDGQELLSGRPDGFTWELSTASFVSPQASRTFAYWPFLIR